MPIKEESLEDIYKALEKEDISSEELDELLSKIEAIEDEEDDLSLSEEQSELVNNFGGKEALEENTTQEESASPPCTTYTQYTQYTHRMSYADIIRQVNNHVTVMKAKRYPLKYITQREKALLVRIDNLTEAGKRRYPASWREFVKGAYRQAVWDRIVFNRIVIPVQWVGEKPYEHTLTKSILKSKYNIGISHKNIAPRRYPPTQLPKELLAYCYRKGEYFCSHSEWEEFNLGESPFRIKGKSALVYEAPLSSRGHLVEKSFTSNKKKYVAPTIDLKINLKDLK